MKRFSAQFIITNSTPILKRGIITTEDDGTVISLEDTAGVIKEKHSIEFYNGIIIPGFVNCHTHLELSHLKNKIPPGEGLGGFISDILGMRGTNREGIAEQISRADSEMYYDGVSLCADICNSSDTFAIKKESRIKYINLLEVFGIDPAGATRRMNEITRITEDANRMNLPFSLTPHSLYSMSLPLLRLLREKSKANKVTSIHFMESPAEKSFLENNTGQLFSAYERSGLIPPRLDSAKNHADAIFQEITPSGNLILVHNTFADREVIHRVNTRSNLYWCLCPNSNLYIEKTLPPVNLLVEEGCMIVVGTDSLASNIKLNIFSELLTLQMNFPFLTIEDMVTWATINGAMALGEDNDFGKIEPGKKPGLLLLQNVDLINMKLLPESFVTRLI